MAIPPNIDQKKTIANVQKQFPTRRKPGNIASVIFAGISLRALTKETARKRVAFEAEGAATYGVSLSVRIGVLNIKKFNTPPFFSYARLDVKKPKTDLERKNALQRERSLLYKHLTSEAGALRKVATFLKVEATIDAIKDKMLEGDLEKQIKNYDDVFKKALKHEKWHNEEYGYYWMGFRRKSALYWLTTLGQQLAAKK